MRADITLKMLYYLPNHFSVTNVPTNIVSDKHVNNKENYWELHTTGYHSSNTKKNKKKTLFSFKIPTFHCICD